MRNSRGGGPVGVTEVELAGPPDPATIEAMPPADVWFNLNGGAFPSFRIDADPVEARLFPWVCRGHNVDGFFGGPLNRWPEVWRERADADYAAWPVDDRNAGHLLYPGRRGLFPSVRLMRLRDGLEDVEYALTALEEGIETDFSAGKAVRPCRWEHFDLEPKPEALADAAGHIERIRVEIGRALSRGNTGGIE
jgi:hypothetical protein